MNGLLVLVFILFFSEALSTSQSQDRARFQPKQRIKQVDFRRVNEDQLNNQLYAVFRLFNITAFTLKTTDGSLRAIVDPQTTVFVPEELSSNRESDEQREQLHNFHNDELRVDVSADPRNSVRQVLNTQTRVQFSKFKEVSPGINRYWARVLPDDHVHVSRRKYAKQPVPVL